MPPRNARRWMPPAQQNAGQAAFDTHIFSSFLCFSDEFHFPRRLNAADNLSRTLSLSSLTALQHARARRRCYHCRRLRDVLTSRAKLVTRVNARFCKARAMLGHDH